MSFPICANLTARVDAFSERMAQGEVMLRTIFFTTLAAGCANFFVAFMWFAVLFAKMREISVSFARMFVQTAIG